MKALSIAYKNKHKIKMNARMTHKKSSKMNPSGNSVLEAWECVPYFLEEPFKVGIVMPCIYT